MDYQPPEANALPEANPEYCALLRAELDAVYDTGLAELRTADREARAKNERAALSIAQQDEEDAKRMVKHAGGTGEAQDDSYHYGYIDHARIDRLATVSN